MILNVSVRFLCSSAVLSALPLASVWIKEVEDCDRRNAESEPNSWQLGKDLGDHRQTTVLKPRVYLERKNHRLLRHSQPISISRKNEISKTLSAVSGESSECCRGEWAEAWPVSSEQTWMVGGTAGVRSIRLSLRPRKELEGPRGGEPFCSRCHLWANKKIFMRGGPQSREAAAHSLWSGASEQSCPLHSLILPQWPQHECSLVDTGKLMGWSDPRPRNEQRTWTKDSSHLPSLQ